ncbi:uncharacterized protein LOC122641982 [Telopea speciosissima]|uniref:uncharacterized protein LOC122641982 n=1 Tax=Telopea speciosissima TaxID=54955 RepID=UPI001CC33BF7|nr:uncharacterized protein LOC122641982 [Telopea speciosissima]
MAKIPVGFKRVAAAFDEVARVRPCESSGSEYSAEGDFSDLSDLIDSFIETDYYGVEREQDNNDEDEQMESEKSIFEDANSESFWSVSEAKEMLQSLLGCEASNSHDGDGSVERMIRNEVEIASRSIGTDSSAGVKRLLMNRLRERGLDAGLCKSRWEKMGRFPGGDYEYIDVIVEGTRYMVEVTLEAEFTIARATDGYLSLLELFPSTFVGKPEELKQVVRLMCVAAKESMKRKNMPVPPWRKNAYMQAKWFGPYKRTTRAGAGSQRKAAVTMGEDLRERRSVGFEASPAIYSYCRVASARKVGLSLKAGNLAAVFNGIGL